jgi:tetratricopeptide (TPR) repeat protein
MSHWVVGINCMVMGDFEAGLEAEGRAQAIGEVIHDPRLQSYAIWTTGWIQATKGDWETALESSRRAIEISPDPYTTNISLWVLGMAYLEQGKPIEAIRLLEQAVLEFERFQYRQVQNWSAAHLSEAYVLNGEIERRGP